MRQKWVTMRICHVITNLDTGGAERMLVKLLGAMDRERFEQSVVCMLGRGTLSDHVEALGVPLEHLGMGRGAASLGSLMKLAGVIRKRRPDVVQTWLYHADLMGYLAARLTRTGKVVWNLRCSDMELTQYRRLTALVLKMNAWLSSRPEAVISNSRRAVDVHLEVGFRPRRVEIIPNGFDVSRFKPDPKAGAAVCKELGIPAGAPVVGMIARFDYMKGHDLYCKAWSILRSRVPTVHTVLVGRDVTRKNQDLLEMAAQLGVSLDGRIHLLGERPDVERIMNAFTLAVIPSRSEGFPNVVGEAMACGVPCVVTDVGDSAYIVGDTGRVAPPGDATALARGLEEMLAMRPEELAEMGKAARERVKVNFSLHAVAARYEALYESLI